MDYDDWKTLAPEEENYPEIIGEIKNTTDIIAKLEELAEHGLQGGQFLWAQTILEYLNKSTHAKSIKLTPYEVVILHSQLDQEDIEVLLELNLTINSILGYYQKDKKLSKLVVTISNDWD